MVAGFALQPEDPAWVATPELVDTLATNALSLRVSDRQLATELYTDLRDQAIRASERWHDVQVRVRLSPTAEPSPVGVPLFSVLIEWEYTVAPTHAVQRFACTSDRDEFHELVSDVPATLGWLMTELAGLNASDRRNYELLTYSIDDHSRVAYVEAHNDETKETATVVLLNAVTWFAARGVVVNRVLSDNGSCYSSHLWAETCAELAVVHKCTRPYRPQTNGKIERLHRILAEGRAFMKFYNSESARLAALPGWLHHYNHHRPHSEIGTQASITV